MLAAVLVAIGLGVAGVVYARWRGAMVLAGALKVSCSLGFVALAVARERPNTEYAAWMLTGLVLSAVGDAILLVRDRRALAIGASAFGIGHLAYIVAWAQFLALTWPVGVAAGVLALVVAGVAYWTRARTKRMVWVVAIYGWVLAASVVCAVGVGLQLGSPLAWTLGLGAPLFLISDVSVLRDRLLTPSLWNPTWGLPCYYAAQVCFALSIAQMSVRL